MAGRPTKLTPECQARIVEAVAAGNYYEAACSYGGIDRVTFDRWMKRGDREPGPYRVFRNAIQDAEARAEVRIVAQWQAQIPDNWQAARDFLARRFPERWGSKDKMTVEFLNSPEWVEMRTLIVNVLRPHPEALQALMESLPENEDK